MYLYGIRSLSFLLIQCWKTDLTINRLTWGIHIFYLGLYILNTLLFLLQVVLNEIDTFFFSILTKIWVMIIIIDLN